MRRPYTQAEYIDLVRRIQQAVPETSLSTDIIVGFPGETQEQFKNSLDLVRELRFDKVHCAAYSPRPATIADRTMSNDVAPDEKTRRRESLETLQQSIQEETNSELLGQEVEVLVEGRHKGKWQGRTRSNKLVYFQNAVDYLGQLVHVNIEKTSAWSLQGTPVPANGSVALEDF
jgi:tRNA-2-methylthio-N6-dimethylallyladenosine synthase